jgi:hypothetical protein
VPTAAELPEEREGGRIPQLPAITVWEPVYRDRELVDEESGEPVTMRETVGEAPRERTWHPMTIAWWDDLWRSPMRSELAKVDLHRFFILADLIDSYWRSPTIALATEIRLQAGRFGLDPMARRSLQWELPKPKPRKRAAKPAPKVEAPAGPIDPRTLLHAVS